jgi:hypothetical protein
MRNWFILGLVLLTGCKLLPQAADISGVWINQAAIDAAAQGRPLLETLNANGWNLQWNIDASTGKAQVHNAYETGTGRLKLESPGRWAVASSGQTIEHLQSVGGQLVQQPRQHLPGQVFRRPGQTIFAGSQGQTTFRLVLNSAYMGGLWRILEGEGFGGSVVFNATGGVSGLGCNDQYELCLGGDCATQGAGYDSLRLGQSHMTNIFIFVRYGNRMEILQAVNSSPLGEIPQFRPGPRQWLLDKSEVAKAIEP